MFWTIVIITGLVLVFGFFIYLGRNGDGPARPDDKRHEVPPRDGDFGGFFGA